MSQIPVVDPPSATAQVVDAVLLMLTLMAAMIAATILATVFTTSPHVTAVVGTVLGVGGGAWAVAHRKGLSRLGPWAKPARPLRAVGAGVGLALLATGLLYLQVAAVPGLGALAERQEELLGPLLRVDSPSWIPIVLLVVAVSPAIFEEYAYRGVMRRVLGSVDPMTRAVTIGLLFSAMHLNVVGLLPLFIVGVAFSWMADASDGWGDSAIAHFTLNAVNGVVLVRLPLDEVPMGALAAVMTLVGGGLLWIAIWSDANVALGRRPR